MRKDQKRDWHGRFVKENKGGPMSVEDMLYIFAADPDIQSIFVKNEQEEPKIELTWFGMQKPDPRNIFVDGSKELDRILNEKEEDNEPYEDTFWDRHGLALMAFIISVVALATALFK